MKKRYVQKMLTMALTAAMICSSVPVSAETVSENETAVTVEEADQAETEDTEVENGKEGYLSYRIYQKPDKTKYVEITECDYDAKGAVEIPTKIKDIAVTSIGYSAFSGCSGLTSIEIPSSVTSIGYYAFSGCSGLTSIEIPEGVTSIENEAFKGCSGLTSIKIPSSVTSIKSEAFEDCIGLTSINVEADNVVYDSRDNCNAIIEKATNTLIQGCKNTKIPSGVTKIGDRAFFGCSGLTSMEIPSSVTKIGDRAFSGCSGLTSMEIPSGVTSIGNYAFHKCSGLTSINVEAGNTVYDSRDNCNAIIETKTNTLIQGCNNTKIPSSVTEIRSFAFIDCSGLTSIEIPKGVTSIEYYVFSGCSGLTSIEIPSSVTSIGYYAFSGCSGLTGIEIPSSVTNIGNSAFSGCSEVTSINVEAGNVVYDSRDNCNAIIEKETNTLIQGCKNTKIPSSVTSIGNYAFFGCSGLTDIEIPKGVTSIGEGAFMDCSGLKDVYYTGTQEQWNAISFGNGGDASDVFVAYDKDLGQNISIPFTLHCNSSRPKPSQQPSAEPSQQPSAAPSPAPSAVPSKTPEADLPAAGTTLKEKTGREFKVTESDGSESKPSVTLTKLSAKDKKAKKVTIPKTVTINNVKYRVTGIAAKAFKNSKKLQSIVIPDTITEIGAGSFEGCKNLKSVTIGKNVTSIGKNAFKNCKNLKKITVKSTKLKKVGKGALTGINRKCVIKVPKKRLKSYKRLFKGKGQKKSVKIKK